MGQEKDKDPAAVALGKKRQAAMTDEEKRAFQQLGLKHAVEATRRRTPDEHRAIARKAAATKRLRKQISLANVNSLPKGNIQPQDRPASHPAPAKPPALADLERLIDEMPDELVARLAAALAGRS